jgi:hypothetical protein
VQTGVPAILRRYRRFGRAHYPCLAAGAFWLAETATVVTGGRAMTVPVHELLGSGTLGVTVWALLHHYLGERRLRPGERIVTEEEFAAVEAAMARAVAECYASKPDEPERAPLRSVPGGA